LVVAYALAGTVDIDLTTQPIGTGRDGEPVFLRDIWPTTEEIASTIARSTNPEDFRKRYGEIFAGDEGWRALNVPEGELYSFDPSSTYIAEPPFVQDTTEDPQPIGDIAGARVLVYVGDSVTTDHISPAGSIPASTPAGEYLIAKGVEPRDFNSYGTRRGNHEVMMRGTFANIRIRNQLAEGKEGGFTTYFPTGEVVTVFDASQRYRADGTPLIVLAGREYGAGSSRDWAAKGTLLLGVRAVLAASYERIHRANLVQMGVLPLELPDTPEALGLTGAEEIDILGLGSLEPGATIDVVLRDGTNERTIQAKARVETHAELRYFREGGILPAVVRDMLKS
jgi:aconitate hydratase